MRIGDVRPLGETQALCKFEMEMDGWGEADQEDESGSDSELRDSVNFGMITVRVWFVVG